MKEANVPSIYPIMLDKTIFKLKLNIKKYDIKFNTLEIKPIKKNLNNSFNLDFSWIPL